MQTDTSWVGFGDDRDRRYQRQRTGDPPGRYCLLVLLPLLLSATMLVAQGNDKGLAVHGIVVSSDHVPVAGAVLRWYHWHPSEEGRSSFYEELTTQSQPRTDANGQFRITGLPAGRLVVLAEAESHAPSTAQYVTLKAQSSPRDLAHLVLRRSHAVEGRVVGKRVAGVRVLLGNHDEPFRHPLESQADDEGYFRFKGLAAGRHYWVKTHATTALSSNGVNDLLVPSPAPVELSLPDGAGVHGVVRGPEGETIADARVGVIVRRVTRSGNSSSTGGIRVSMVTDEQGRFAALGLPEGELAIYVRHTEYAGSFVMQGNLEADEALGPLFLQMVRGRPLEVSTVGAAGEIAAGTYVYRVHRIEFENGHELLELEGPTQSDHTGTVPMRLEPGNNTLIALHPDVGRIEVEVDGESWSNEPLRLSRAGMITGHIVDRNGEPVHGARIHIEPHPDVKPSISHSLPWTGSNQDGFYLFSQLPLIKYLLKIEHSDYETLAMTVQLSAKGLEPLQHELVAKDKTQAVTTLSLRVPGLPRTELSNLQVNALPVGGSTGRIATLDGEVFRIPQLEPGQWTIDLRLPGTGFNVHRELTISPGSPEEELEVAFADRGHTLTGRVQLNGAPPDLETSHADLRSGESLSNPISVTVQVQPDGSFRVPYLEQGEYLLELSHTWGTLGRRVWVEGETEIELSVRSHPLVGRVEAGVSGTQVEGTTVHVLTPTERGWKTWFATHCGADGGFSFPHLLPGPTIVQVKEGPAVSRPVVLDIGPDLAPLTLELVAPHSVELKLPPLAPELAGATTVVSAVDSEGNIFRSYELKPETQGRVSVSGPPAGAWRLLIRHGYQRAVFRVQIPGPPVEAHFPEPLEVDLRVLALEGVAPAPEHSDRALGLLFLHRIPGTDDEPWQQPLFPSVAPLHSERYVGPIAGLSAGPWRPEVVLEDGRRLVGKVIHIQAGTKNELIFE